MPRFQQVTHITELLKNGRAEYFTDLCGTVRATKNLDDCYFHWETEGQRSRSRWLSLLKESCKAVKDHRGQERKRTGVWSGSLTLRLGKLQVVTLWTPAPSMAAPNDTGVF